MATGNVTIHVLIEGYDLDDLAALRTRIQNFLNSEAGSELTEFCFAETPEEAP